ncbi:MAG TPA: hypothetical protein DGT21_15105 [Armatimonadetes bacterium]|nr:hypothetical protein [Armatimonadota bacterium]
MRLPGPSLTRHTTLDANGRHRLALLLSSAVVFGIVAGCSNTASQPMAKVGEKLITAAEFEHALMLDRGGQLLLEMVDTELILAEAQRRRLSASQEEIASRVELGVAQMASEAEFSRRLEQRGQSLEEYSEVCRAELLLDKMARELVDTSDEVLQAYYDLHKEQFRHEKQAHARWMLFGDRESAEAVREALKDPEAEFAGLAQALSLDATTKDNGGDMGFFEAKDYAPAVSEVAFSLDPRQVSAVFQVPDGWAVLELIEIRPAGTLPFEEVREMLRARVIAEMLPTARGQWLDAARKNARIVVADERLDGQIKALIASSAPYRPSQLLNVPMAPPNAPGGDSAAAPPRP